MRRLLKSGLAVVVLLGGVLAVGFAAGIFGVPAVEGVENRFGGVNDTSTVVETDLTVANPNPVGVALGGLDVDYTVLMNDVPMANGTKRGVAIETGNSTLDFTTRMANTRIPAWWYAHVRNGEETAVVIDATVTSSTLGGRSTSLKQTKAVETDIVGQFNSSETRPVNANSTVVSDPILYVNATRGWWDRGNLTRDRTPVAVEFDVYNPKYYGYVVSEIGYTITMNDVVVGEGSTGRATTLPPRTEQTISTRTAIRNQHLDEWWVSHLERNQVTDLRIEFYAVLDPSDAGIPGAEPIRVQLDPLDYQRTIETDIFGTKDETGDGGDAGDVEEPTPRADGTDTATPDDGTTTTDDGMVTVPGDETETATPTERPTDSPTDGDDTTTTDGGGTTTTDDGLL